MRKLLLALILILAGARLQAQFDPSDLWYQVPTFNGGSLVMPPSFSDMAWAVQHDARWVLAGGSHIAGATSGRTQVFTGGANLFTKVGDSFQKVLLFMNEIQKGAELVAQAKAMIRFLDEYQLRINVCKFIPNMIIQEPDSISGGPGRSIMVGFLPKHGSNTWKTNASMMGDNPYYRPRGSVKLVEIRYPRSWSDIKIDGSVWGADNLAEDEIQKQLLSGFYDGTVSAARFLSDIGVDNNLEMNVGRLSPKALATQKAAVIDRRIQALQDQWNRLDAALRNPSSEEGRAFSSMNVQDRVKMQDAIKLEIAKLEKTKAETLGVEISRNAPWVQQAEIVHQVLSRLETSERRITIARLSERFKKYQKAWSNPSFMVQEPEITGNEQVDRAIYIIWQAITLLSKGKVAPPQAVSGGPAAEAQAALTKAMYRHLTAEELHGIRQMLAAENQFAAQAKGVEVVKDAKEDIAWYFTALLQGERRIQELQAMNAAKQAIDASAWQKMATTVPF